MDYELASQKYARRRAHQGLNELQKLEDVQVRFLCIFGPVPPKIWQTDYYPVLAAREGVNERLVFGKSLRASKVHVWVSLAVDIPLMHALQFCGSEAMQIRQWKSKAPG